MYHKNQSQHAYLAAHKNPPSSHHHSYHATNNNNNNNNNYDTNKNDFVVNQTYRKSPIVQPISLHSKAHINNNSSSGAGGGSGNIKQAKIINNTGHSDVTMTNNKRPQSRSQSRLLQAEQLSLGCGGKCAKFFLFLTNLLFWSAGFAIGTWGILFLVEDSRFNLSNLLVFEPNSKLSLFQLLSWSFIILGSAAILVGCCGCTALVKNNRWIVGLYIFLILAILALDLATGLLAMIFQEKLVADVRLRLVNKLKSDYGVHASFTAAIDFLQTRYECCGMDGHFDYDQSTWRTQRLGGPEASVARTCCHLRNNHDEQAHINPRPINESMCQSSDTRFYQSYRHRKGCLDDLERLIRYKSWTFILGCCATAAIIVICGIFAFCYCKALSSSTKRTKYIKEHQQTSMIKEF